MKANLKSAVTGKRATEVSGGRGRRAFSQIDLLALIGVLAVLAGWFGFKHGGERGRIARCTANLKDLGDAMHRFAGDHGGALPPAGIEPLQTTWDMQLYSYLKPGQAAGDELIASVAPRFFCPSDPIKRGDRPRSYAMSAHSMTPDNWPPGPDNTTGVGLWWTTNRISQR